MAFTESTDEALVCQSCAGDRNAFAELYRRYAPVVNGLLLARLPRDEVEDHIQDVFVSALRSLTSLREPAAFGAWLCSIARNRARDYYRLSGRAGAHGKSSENFSPRESATEASTALAAIRSLPEAYRETMLLRLVEGLTGPEIAARTGLTHGSVRVNLHRGMKTLRELLEKGPEK